MNNQRISQDSSKVATPLRVETKKDILLLLLYSPGRTPEVNEPIVGRTRLVKMIFLFWKELMVPFKRGTALTEDRFYQFFAWNYGPFSKEVYDDLLFFELREFIARRASEQEVLPEAAAEWTEWMQMSSTGEDSNGVTEYEEQEFVLTTKGTGFTEALYASLNQGQRDILRRFKSKLNVMPLKAILRYVYETYPEYADKSIIRDKVFH